MSYRMVGDARGAVKQELHTLMGTSLATHKKFKKRGVLRLNILSAAKDLSSPSASIQK